jgi:acyl-CoA thioesterase
MMDASPARCDPTPPILRAEIERLFMCDTFSKQFDIRLVEAVRGRAQLTMQVSEARMNAHGGCHGGALWTLADMAFGTAGYYDGPMLTVGSDLSFIRPAPRDVTVHATATEITRTGRTGIFHIVLTTAPEDPAAIVATGMFTGRWTHPIAETAT